MQPVGMIGLNGQHPAVTILGLVEQASLVALDSALQKFHRTRVDQNLLTVGGCSTLIPFHFNGLLKRRMGRHLHAEIRQGQPPGDDMPPAEKTLQRND